MAGNGRKQGGRKARSLGERLLPRLITLRRLRSIALQNRDFSVAAPAALRLRAWRLGFSRRDWLLYELDRHDPGEYLPHHASLDFGFHFPHYRSLNDKLLLARALGAIGIAHPEPLAFVLRGRILPCSGGGSGQPAGDWTADQARRRGAVVLKPVVGLAGSGLLFVRAASVGWTANGVAVTRAGLQELLAGLDQYVVTEHVRQAAYAAAIFPQAANTLRLLTLWDYGENRPFLAAAAQRFGSSRSLPVDNFHAGSGGLCAGIDIASARLGPAVTLDDSGNLLRLERHPESAAAIAGVVIPDWQQAHAAVLRAAAAFPESPFIGWDIVMTDEGPSFIEANVPPSIHIWQVHGGLLRDPRALHFFAAHGMVPGRRGSGHGPREGAGAAAKPAPRRGAGTVAGKRPRAEAAFPAGIPGRAFAGYPLPVSERLKLGLAPWRRLAALMAADRHAPFAPAARLRAWRRGFCARHWALCDLDRHSPAEYVRDFVELDFGIRDANFLAVNDRLLCHRVLDALAVEHARPLGYVQRGSAVSFDGDEGARGQPAEWLAGEAARRGAIAFRPVHARSGMATLVLRGSDRGLTLDGRAVAVGEVQRLLAGLDRYLICEFVAPPAYAAAICPAASGSLRILTLWDYAAQRPFVAAAVHPFAGLLAGVEPAGGMLKAAVALDGRGCRREYPRHPVSGAEIAGLTLPLWPQTLAAVLRAAAALPGSPCLGWEIVIGGQAPCIIQVDAPPALWEFQVHGGLLNDPRAREFFAVHGMVPPRDGAT